MRTWVHLGKIALLASVFTFSVVGGNISLKYVPVSFNQARVTFCNSIRDCPNEVVMTAVMLLMWDTEVCCGIQRYYLGVRQCGHHDQAEPMTRTTGYQFSAQPSTTCSRDSQAVGATTPAFTVLLGWLINGHMESCRVCCALIPVVAGIVITSGFEPSFHVVGLLFLLSSTAARAYKSLLQVRLGFGAQQSAATSHFVDTDPSSDSSLLPSLPLSCSRTVCSWLAMCGSDACTAGPNFRQQMHPHNHSPAT